MIVIPRNYRRRLLKTSFSQREGLEFESPWLHHLSLNLFFRIQCDLTHAFHGGEGAVGFGIGIKDEDFEGPVFAGLNGLGVGGDVCIGDDLAGVIE